jgi:hypothetical protein
VCSTEERARLRIRLTKEQDADSGRLNAAREARLRHLLAAVSSLGKCLQYQGKERSSSARGVRVLYRLVALHFSNDGVAAVRGAWRCGWTGDV